MRSLLFLAIVCVSACTAGPYGSSDLLETSTFRFHQQTPEQARWYQRQYDALSAQFGFALPRGAFIDFYGYDDKATCAEGFCAVPTGFAVACAGWPEHDDCDRRLTALYATLLGASVPLLRAGLVEVLAGGGSLGVTIPPPDRSLDILGQLDLLPERTSDGDQLRSTAASFVRFLIDQFGPAKIGELLHDISDATWTRIAGVTIADAVAAWRQADSYDSRQYAWLGPECGSDPAEQVDPDHWKADLTFDSPTSINLTGTLFRFDRWVHARSFHLVEPSVVTITVEGASGPLVSFESCAGPRGPAPLATQPQLATQNGTIWLETPRTQAVRGYIPAGDYAAFVYAGSQPVPQVALTITTARPAISEELRAR